jgi:hypothetical protein
MMESVRSEALIHHLLQGTCSETGHDFFHALVRSAAMALDVAAVKEIPMFTARSYYFILLSALIYLPGLRSISLSEKSRSLRQATNLNYEMTS